MGGLLFWAWAALLGVVLKKKSIAEDRKIKMIFCETMDNYVGRIGRCSQSGCYILDKII